MSEAMKVTWANYKLKQAMKQKIVSFYFRKVSGEIRQAFGTLEDSTIAGSVKGTGRKPNEKLFTYLGLIAHFTPIYHTLN